MQPTAETIKCLGEALQMEADNRAQYDHNCRDLKQEGIGGVCKVFKALKGTAKEWFKRNADDLRLVGGSPSYSIDDQEDFTSVADMLNDALSRETGAYDFYTAEIPKLRDAGDETEAHIFQHAAKAHRYCIGEVNTELSLLKRLGEEAYIAART